MSNALISHIQGSIEIDPARSRIKLAGSEVAYHCEKFSTRIIRGLEDVLGIEEASALIQRAAAESLYESLSKLPEAQSGWETIPRPERLVLIFTIFKMLGYGSVSVAEANGNIAQVISPNSYLAEGFFENARQWRWSKRSVPFCHDMCGYLRAAFAMSEGVPLDNVKVTETTCRTTGTEVCSFQVEVTR